METGFADLQVEGTSLHLADKGRLLTAHTADSEQRGSERLQLRGGAKAPPPIETAGRRRPRPWYPATQHPHQHPRDAHEWQVLLTRWDSREGRRHTSVSHEHQQPLVWSRTKFSRVTRDKTTGSNTPLSAPDTPRRKPVAPASPTATRRAGPWA